MTFPSGRFKEHLYRCLACGAEWLVLGYVDDYRP